MILTLLLLVVSSEREYSIFIQGDSHGGVRQHQDAQDGRPAASNCPRQEAGSQAQEETHQGCPGPGIYPASLSMKESCSANIYVKHFLAGAHHW